MEITQQLGAHKLMFLHSSTTSETLQSHIAQIALHAHSYDSIKYQIAQKNFQVFIETLYRYMKETNEEALFYDELFVSTSLSQLNQNTLTYLAILDSLINASIGNKIFKANRMARDLVNIPPDPNPLIWRLLSRNLKWMSKPLKPSMQLILHPLTESMWKWCSLKDTDKVDAGMQCLTILLKDFPQQFEGQNIHVQTTILECLDIDSNDVHQHAIDALKIYLKTTSPSNKQIVNFCGQLSFTLSDTNWHLYNSALECAQIILEIIPDLKGCFTFNKLPTQFLSDKDPDAQTAALRVIPFAYKTTPKLFSQEITDSLLNDYKSLIQKRSPCRKTALTSLGYFLFQVKSSNGTLTQVLLIKLRHIILESFDCDAAMYALLGLMCFIPDDSNRDLTTVLTRQISETMIDGLSNYITNVHKKENIVHKSILSIGSDILLKENASNSVISTVFNAFVTLKVDLTMLSETLALQFGSYLTHSDLEVRQAVVHFLIWYQKKTNSEAIAQILLSVVFTETNSILRKHIIKKLNGSLTDTNSIQCLRALMHDSDRKVSREAISQLAAVAYDQTAFEILTKFIEQSLNETITKDQLESIIRIASVKTPHVRRVLKSYSSSLFSKIMAVAPTLSSSALLLLSLIVEYADSIDMERLVMHLDSAFNVCATKHRIDNALLLFISAMEFTDLRFLIYTKFTSIIPRLIEISKLSTSFASTELLQKALSLIGVISPNNHLFSGGSTKSKAKVSNTAPIFMDQSGTNDPYESLTYASVGVAISNIMDILMDESFSSLHSPAIDALLVILKTYRQIGKSLEGLLIKRLNDVFERGGDSTYAALLKNMSTLITVLEKRFEPLVPHVVHFLKKKWAKFDRFLLLRITQWLMRYTPEVFQKFLPEVISLFMRDFETHEPKLVDAILATLISFGPSIQTTTHIVYPPLIQWLIFNSTKTSQIEEFIDQLKIIFVNGDTKDFCSEIIRATILAVQMNPALNDKLVELISIIAAQNKDIFLRFSTQIAQNFTLSQLYTSIINSIQSKLPLSADVIKMITPAELTKSDRSKSKSFILPKNLQISKETATIKVPQLSWDEFQWRTWSDSLFNGLVRSSSSRAISACAYLAEHHSQLQNAIFPLALTIYYVASPNKNETFCGIFFAVMKSPHCPASVIRYFLGVIELLEILNIKLPVSYELVANAAEKSSNIPIALRAAEHLFDSNNETMTERLVVYNKSLGLPLAANGILKSAQKKNFKFDEIKIAEELGLWNEVLPKIDPSLVEKRLNCLKNLSMYSEIRHCNCKLDESLSSLIALKLFDYKGITLKEAKSFDDCFALIVKEIIAENYTEAEHRISKTNQLLTKQMFPFQDQKINEWASCSLLRQLYEVVLINRMKQFANSSIPARRLESQEVYNTYKQIWKQRFQFLPEDDRLLHNFLIVVDLCYSPDDFQDEWIFFLDKAISNKHFSLASSTISYLKTKTLKFQDRLLGEELKILFDPDMEIKTHPDESFCIYAAQRCLADSRYQQSYQILKPFIEDNQNSAIWLLWSKINLELFNSTSKEEYLLDSLNASIEGLSHEQSRTLDFVIRILSILFQRGSSSIYSLFLEKFQKVPLRYWVDVIPQIIARLSSSDAPLRSLVVKIIFEVGLKFPQATLYSLLIPYTSEDPEKKEIANNLFSKLRTDFPSIVDGIIKLATEFMRVAITKWEVLYSLIDEAIRFPSKDFTALLTGLKHVIKPPETFYEVSFYSQFGQSLSESVRLLELYNSTSDEGYLHQMWHFLLQIYSKLKQIISELTIIPLKDASPLLHQFNSRELNIPGSFMAGSPTIDSFKETLLVILSKQRPRKMTIYGSDGHKHMFLLKANEDTRLDERVMQLFLFINSLIKQSSMPLKKELPITTYKVIPLSNTVGIIGWVPNCITLFEQIKKHRDRLGIAVDTESAALHRICPTFETKKNEEKVVAFEEALKVTSGNDLKEIILIGAHNSLHWIQRRTNYTASMATMSISGYILGLGDRHLNNIMMKSKSAKLAHIDFGDCFEVAMHRERFPEKVPFRLTRVLINAFEVSKIEGTYRKCCENVMCLLRENGDQILGLLEAFIYDPLLQWTSGVSQGSSPIQIVARIKDKLTGNDLEGVTNADVTRQVDELIRQASDPRNLCEMYKGWIPWW